MNCNACFILSNSCHCEEQNIDNQNGTVHVRYHSGGKCSNLKGLPLEALSKMLYLTSADVQIYTTVI